MKRYRLVIILLVCLAALAVCPAPARAQYHTALNDAVDNYFYPISTDVIAPWVVVSNEKVWGDTAAKSGPIIGASSNSSMAIRVNDDWGGTVRFYWKVSSEPNYDKLEFLIDGVVQASISGEVGWNEVAFQVPYGNHMLVWRYIKDATQTAGQDCSWVDHIRYYPDIGDLSYVLSGYDLGFTTSEPCAWYANYLPYDWIVTSASGVPHNGLSWLTTRVLGPGTMVFYWGASSEFNFDWLSLYLDGVLQDRISGEVALTQKTLKIPPGDHEVQWRYVKDSSMTHGYDCGFLSGVYILAPPKVRGNTWLFLLLDE